MWSGDRENLGCNENSHHTQINENLTAALPPHPPRIQTWVLVWALRDLKQVPICFGTSVSPPVKQWLFLTTPESQGPGTVRGPTKDPARLRMFTTSDPSTQASPAGPGSFHAGLAFLGSFSKQTLSPFLS